MNWSLGKNGGDIGSFSLKISISSSTKNPLIAETGYMLMLGNIDFQWSIDSSKSSWVDRSILLIKRMIGILKEFNFWGNKL